MKLYTNVVLKVYAFHRVLFFSLLPNLARPRFNSGLVLQPWRLVDAAQNRLAQPNPSRLSATWLLGFNIIVITSLGQL